MRNPLFSDTPGAATLQQQRQTAEKCVDHLPRREEIMAVLRQWWELVACPHALEQPDDSYYTQASSDQADVSKLESYKERIAQLTASSTPFSAVLVSSLDRYDFLGNHSDHAMAASLIIADSIAGSLAAGQPDLRRLKVAYRFLQSDRFLFERFENALVDNVQIALHRKQEWLTFLGTTLITSYRIPSSEEFSEGEREQLSDAVEEWQRCQDPFFAVQARYENNYVRPLSTSFLSRLLLRIDVDAWLRAVDTFSLPYHVWGATKVSEICEDGDMLRLLLHKAPQVFDAKGVWTRSTLALILTDLFYDYAKKWHMAILTKIQRGFFHLTQEEASIQRLEAETALKVLETDELPRWLSESYGVLLQRPDGPPLALRFLSQLARLAVQGDYAERNGNWRLSECACNAMALAFAQAGLTAADVRQLWSRFIAQYPPYDEEDEQATHKNLQREAFPVFIGAIAVSDTHYELKTLNEEILQDIGSGLWEWLDELLEKQDLRLINSTSRNNFMYAYWAVSRLLWRVSEPCQAWETTYKKLDAQRRNMANINAPYHLGEAFQSSDFLIAIGVGFVYYVLQNKHFACTKHDAIIFTWDLIRKAFALYLTDTGDRPRSKNLQNIIVDCYCLLAKLYPLEYELVLEFALTLLGSDDDLINGIYKGLISQGCSSVAILAVFGRAGLNPIASSARLQKWQGLMPTSSTL